MIFGGASKFPLLAIPLFILAGGLMTTTGISTRLINLASALVGFIRGGLAMVTIVASMFFGEISGSAVAGAAAIGQVVIPAMEKKGYPKAFSAGVVSNAATLAIIIPPSIPMIIYAAMADTSVVKLFISGVIPGIIGGGLMMVLSYYFARTRGYPAETTFGSETGPSAEEGFLGPDDPGGNLGWNLWRNSNGHRSRGAGGPGGDPDRGFHLPGA